MNGPVRILRDSRRRTVRSRFVLALAAFLLGPYGAWVETPEDATPSRHDAVR